MRFYRIMSLFRQLFIFLQLFIFYQAPEQPSVGTRMLFNLELSLGKKLFENIVGKDENRYSIFSISQNVFYPNKEKLHHLKPNEIVVSKYYQFGEAKDLLYRDSRVPAQILMPLLILL